jgi:hypothetical protein
MQTGNPYDVAMTMNPFTAQNISSTTSKIESLPETARAIMETTKAAIDKPSTNERSIPSKHNTIHALAVSSKAAEV